MTREKYDSKTASRTPGVKVKSIFLNFLLIGSIGLSHTAFSDEISEMKQSIEQALSLNFKNDTLVGAVVGVSYQGQTFFLSKGSSGRLENPALTENDIFEIGSITKTMTSMALAKEVIRGRVRLDTKVSELWKELKGFDAGDITLVELATHSSGLPRMPTNFNPSDWSNPYKDYDKKLLLDFLKSFKRPKEKMPPLYSNVGMGLLGVLLADNLNQTSFSHYIKDQVFRPIKLTSSFVNLDEIDRSLLAIGHNGFFEVMPHWDLGAMTAAGAVKSSIRDLLKYGEYFLNPTSPFDGEVVDLVSKVRTDFNEGIAYGLGWGIVDIGDRSVLTHTGATGGFTSMIVIDKTRQLVLTAISNSDVLPSCMFSKILGRECEVPVYLKLSEEELVPFLGEYENQEINMQAEISMRNGKLAISPSEQPTLRLMAVGQSEFKIPSAGATVSFQKDGSFVLRQSGSQFVFVRIGDSQNALKH